MCIFKRKCLSDERIHIEFILMPTIVVGIRWDESVIFYLISYLYIHIYIYIYIQTTFLSVACVYNGVIRYLV